LVPGTVTPKEKEKDHGDQEGCRLDLKLYRPSIEVEIMGKGESALAYYR
jgi:hypothetical protein